MIEKISRICWNDFKWRKPSGTNGKSRSFNAYENKSGFGHEEWLFDKSKVVKGYHYGFIEPLQKGKHAGSTYKIWLYTITSKQKFLLGYINNAICVTEKESNEIYEIYKHNGWIDEMLADLERAGIVAGEWKRKWEKWKDTFFNLKFKITDIFLFDDYQKISQIDKNITTPRYQLLNKTSDFKFDKPKEKGTESYSRKSISATLVDPYHNKIQNTLVRILRSSGQYIKVEVEKDNVDVQAIYSKEYLHFFEIKTDTVKNNIRNAIGQLFEYSFFPDIKKAKKLIIVGDTEPSIEAKNYMKHLRKLTGLQIYYRWLDMNKEILSLEL